MTQKLSIENLVIEAKKPTGKWFEIIHGVSVTVKPGEVLALIGESGAGKSTLGLAALGYSRPGTRITGGNVRLGEMDILNLTRPQIRDFRGRQVAYVAQSAYAAINPAIVLGEQVAEGLLVHTIGNRAERKRRVIKMMEILDLPDAENMARQYPHQVSGGQQQRVMVAMAMIDKPGLIVFDEPTTALDVTTQIEVLKAIKKGNREKGNSAIYISHDLSVVAQVADRIVVLLDGRIVEIGNTPELLANPQEDYTRQLLGAVRQIPKVTTGKIYAPRTGEGAGPPLLELKGIHASYQRSTWLHPIPMNRNILRGVSFQVEAGKIVALVGESGSGKSTIARVISGLLPPISGELRFQDKPLPASIRQRPLDQLRRIQMVCQSPDTTLNPEQQISEAIGRPLKLYFGLKNSQRRERVEELLSMVELPGDYADRYPSELSGGEKQRVSLARAFAADPEVILCDEILSALDTVVASAVLEMLKNLQRKMGTAYLFISHDLATVATIVDRVVVLYAGQVCEEGPAAKVFAPPYHPYTALLISSVPELRTGWLEDVLASRQAETGIVHGGMAPRDNGCAFRTRCPLAIPGLCDLQPPGKKILANGHVVYCHREIQELSQ